MKTSISADEISSLLDAVIALMNEKTGVLIEPLTTPSEKVVNPNTHPFILPIEYQVYAPSDAHPNNPRVVSPEQLVVVEKIIDKLVENNSIFETITKTLNELSFFPTAKHPYDLPCDDYFHRAHTYGKRGELNNEPIRISIRRSNVTTFFYIRID